MTFTRRSDLTLVSSDGVHFHVNSVVLSDASPIFADLFTIPQPASSDAGSTPEVAMSEATEELELLLG